MASTTSACLICICIHEPPSSLLLISICHILRRPRWGRVRFKQPGGHPGNTKSRPEESALGRACRRRLLSAGGHRVLGPSQADHILWSALQLSGPHLSEGSALNGQISHAGYAVCGLEFLLSPLLVSSVTSAWRPACNKQRSLPIISDGREGEKRDRR